MTAGHADPHKLKEREFEIGMDEFFKGLSEAWGANVKNTYDIQQNLVVNALKQAQQELASINAITIQALNDSKTVTSRSNTLAVGTDNMVGKQAVRHGDLAIDHQWNKEVAEGVAEAAILKAASKIINEQK